MTALSPASTLSQDVRTVKRLERRLERNILRSMGVEGTTVGGLVEG